MTFNFLGFALIFREGSPAFSTILPGLFVPNPFVPSTLSPLPILATSLCFSVDENLNQLHDFPI